MTRRHVVLYGDVNLNVMDGSAAWLVSLAETLALTNSTVHVLLKAEIITDRLLTRISGRDDIVIHQPVMASGSPAMTQQEAVTRLEDITQAVDASVLIVRGRMMTHLVAQSDVLSPILWSYITDYTFPATVMQPAELAQLRYIASRSRRVLMQTEDSRTYFESVVPEAPGRTLLMNPTVPDDFFAELRHRGAGPLKLIYSGKFAPDWRTLEMLMLPSRLRDGGTDAVLTMVGDKIGGPDPTWNTAMREGLEHPPEGTQWRGGLPREEAIAEVTAHDIGLSWRTANLDASLEISTKMLEYAAAGTPPLLNRTRAHEDLFGQNYPLMLDNDQEETVLAVLSRAMPQLDAIRAKAQEAVRRYSSSSTAARFESYFKRAEADLEAHPVRPVPVKVVLAGHDFKFAGELIDSLRARPDIELRMDHWSGLSEHDEASSAELLQWADVVICEWAGPNAVWYAARVRDDQRLLVRLHRFELTSAWLPDIQISNVDAIITVSSYYQDMVRRHTDWPHDKILAIPNGVDTLDLRRAKRPGAKFTLGLVGIVPFLKRPDRALDLLETLVRQDDRFTLLIRGRMPWEYPWIWRKPLEQEPYLSFFERIGSSRLLQEHVVFSPFGPDMGSWLRSVGWLLSPSDHESFHLAPAEGMASGALPVFWPRDGVEQIFTDRFLHQDVEDMATFIQAHAADADRWDGAQADAQSIVAAFDSCVVESAWLDLVLDGAAVSRGPASAHEARPGRAG